MRTAALQADDKDIWKWNSWKVFETKVSKAFMEDIPLSVIPRTCLEFESEQDHFYFTVADKYHPGINIIYKCIYHAESEKLQIQKIETSPVRHLVADISCLDKHLDLRFALLTKRIIKHLGEEEEEWRNHLIESAILDPGVVGGLRWPPQTIEPAYQRFHLVAFWHTKCRLYANETMLLKLRFAERYDCITSKGEVINDVTLKFTALSKCLTENIAETENLVEMIQEGVNLFWDHFLDHKL